MMHNSCSNIAILMYNLKCSDMIKVEKYIKHGNNIIHSILVKIFKFLMHVCQIEDINSR